MRVLKAIKDMPKGRKIQVITAMALTLSIMIVTPTYSWFRRQQKMARYEKVSSPNTLYITAASREDVRSFQIAGVDVSDSAYWLNNDKSLAGRKTYQDYVFAVAGDYVVSYTLQLAHTTNNNYKYEIFEAEVMAGPAANTVLDRDYIVYDITGDFDPETLEEITANPVYTAKAAPNADKKLYYKIRKDNSNPAKNISLNATNYTNATNVSPSSYTITGQNDPVTYNGHYLNYQSNFSANGSRHNDTYGSGNTNSNVETHAEPLYWQATGIPGGDPTSGDPFYHEYILRISWDTIGLNKATTDYKDTDIIYITAKAE